MVKNVGWVVAASGEGWVMAVMGAVQAVAMTGAECSAVLAMGSG